MSAKEFTAQIRNKRRKITAILVKYEINLEGKLRNFYFELPEYDAFMGSRGHELGTLMKTAVEQNPKQNHFEFTGSHFTPLTNKGWKSLAWTEDGTSLKRCSECGEEKTEAGFMVVGKPWTGKPLGNLRNLESGEMVCWDCWKRIEGR